MLALGGWAASHAATITVCASGCDHTTIAAAVTAATAGDIIQINDAVHTESDISINKDLTIQGANHLIPAPIVQAAATPGGSLDRVFKVPAGTSVNFLYLTIRHGHATDAGGTGSGKTGGGAIIRVNSSSAVNFNNVTITDNQSLEEGGGIHIAGNGGSITFTDCRIVNNDAGSGGGVFSGGGIWHNGAVNLTMIRCTIGNNTAGDDGGGLSIVGNGSSNQMINCTVHDNVCALASGNGKREGGGIQIDAGPTSTELINCTVVNNRLNTTQSSKRKGGGIFWKGGNLTLTNTIIANNSGAASSTDGDDVFEHNNAGTLSITTSLVEDCDGCSSAPTFTSDPNLATVALCGEQSFFDPQVASDALGNGTAPGGNIPTNDICGVIRDASHDLGSVDPNVAKTGPTALCKNVTVSLDENGMAIIVPSDVDNGSSDVLSIDARSISMSSFNCSDAGQNTVTLTVASPSRATSSCTADVEIASTPVAICMDITVELDGSGNASIVASDIDDGSSDPCGPVTLSASHTTFDCGHIGDNTVMLTVTNGNNGMATCTANVEVQDKIDPTINCPTGTLRRNTDPGACTHTVVGSDLDPSPIDDNCTVASITNDFNNMSSLGGEILPKGKTTVTWTVTDQSGNSTTCTYMIRVRDREAPVFDNCPDDANLLVPFCTPGIVHTWPQITATDNCTGPNGIVYSPAILSGSTFPVGTTTVMLTATDRAGNVAPCSFDVNVAEDCDPLPAGMYNEDIGNTGGVVGRVCYDAPTKTYEMKTSGSGIPSVMSNMDGFHYVKRQENASTMDIKARIVMHPTNNNRDRVGVMIREHSYGSNPSAANVATLIAGDNKTYMTNRAMSGSFTTSIAGPTLPGPLWPGPVYWVRLQRTGFSFTASVSPDGATWTTIGTMASYVMPMYGGTYDVGIVGTAGNPGTVVHYTIDNVTINGTAYRMDANGLEPLEVAAFPNPTQDRLNVQLATPAFTQVELTLSNAMGQRLLIERFEADASGIISRRLEMGDLAAGMYMLEVKTATESKTIKVQKF